MDLLDAGHPSIARRLETTAVDRTEAPPKPQRARNKRGRAIRARHDYRGQVSHDCLLYPCAGDCDVNTSMRVTTAGHFCTWLVLMDADRRESSFTVPLSV
jgi:hypothetical protein